jgi:hypothetical protein
MPASVPAAETVRPEEQAPAHYAAISKAAIGALVLGLAAPLFLASPLLIVVPLAGLALAVVALRQIAASEGELKGTWPATIGLCLATLFLGWGLTHQVTRKAELAEQAERFADGWLALVREGKLQQADQLMRDSASRPRTDEELAEYYKTNMEASENMQMFFGREPMQGFLAAGPQVTYALRRVASQTQYSSTDEIILEYEYESSQGDGPRTMWISVARRANDVGRPANWIVRSADAVVPVSVQ